MLDFVEFLLNWSTSSILIAIILAGTLAILYGLIYLISWILVKFTKHLKLYKSFSEFLYNKYRKKD